MCKYIYLAHLQKVFISMDKDVIHLIKGEEEKEIRQIKKEVPGKEERRTRSGRRRENPEGTTISSVKEDPFDHRDRVCDLLVSFFSVFLYF